MERKTEWYENNIEEPVRGLVRFLHSKGIDTFGSCAHRAYITVSNEYDILEIAIRVLEYMKNDKSITPEFIINKKIICLGGALSDLYVDIDLKEFIKQHPEGDKYLSDATYKKLI